MVTLLSSATDIFGVEASQGTSSSEIKSKDSSTMTPYYLLPHTSSFCSPQAYPLPVPWVLELY